MATTIEDPAVRALLDGNHAVISTLNEDGAVHPRDAHIDSLAMTYLGVAAYPYRQPDEQRITYLLTADLVRHQKQ